MNLALFTPGQSYKSVVTISNTDPVPTQVYRVEFGDGTGTSLWLGNGIVGVGGSATLQTQLASEASAPRAVTFPDQAGRAVIAADLRVRLATDFTLPTTTAETDVPGMLLNLPPGIWAVFLTGLVQTSNADNGVIFATSGTAVILGGTFTADPSSSPTSTANHGRASIVIAQVSSGVGSVQLRAANELASRTTQVRTGTTMFALRIA